MDQKCHGRPLQVNRKRRISLHGPNRKRFLISNIFFNGRVESRSPGSDIIEWQVDNVEMAQ